MKEYVGIYIKIEKSTGTRWLWQQNEIPLPHNNYTSVNIFSLCFAFTLAIYTYVGGSGIALYCLYLYS